MLKMVKDSKRKIDKLAKKSKERVGGASDEPVTRETSSSVLVTAIPSTAAQIVMKRFAVVTGIDGLLKEFAELKAVSPKPEPPNRASFDKNVNKNRYKDIYCMEANRVMLNWPPDDQIICTQGPMENTLVDFWRMIWQENCSSILMLCSVMETGKKKCEQYWPEKTQETINVANLMIKNLEVSLQGEVQVTKLCVYGKGSDGTLKEHIVVHVQWTGWPDKSVPISAVGAIRAIVRTQNFSPLVVHCSAGNTFSTILINLR
uniref:Tyrosine-protein phosphatase domain-containing protein n=1 Tax=Ditylenchus dipsaci TaxID=166011 RepID=A0A915D2L0_9BILA